jgi:hypothetical protein
MARTVFSSMLMAVAMETFDRNRHWSSIQPTARSVMRRGSATKGSFSRDVTPQAVQFLRRRFTLSFVR